MADDEKSLAHRQPEKSSNMASNSPQTDSEDVFEVEKIIAMTKTKGKKTLYRVRWFGYGPDYDTWEPYDNLDSCRQMVDKFIRNEERKKQERHKKKVPVEPEVVKQPVPMEQASTSAAANRKAPTWKYVSSDQAEFDTLKDKFWRDLEQGRVDVFQAGDMYSKVKGSTGRASRPKSFTEMFQNKIPTATETKPEKSSSRSKSSKGQHKGKRRKSAGTPDSEASAGIIGQKAAHVNTAKRGRGSRVHAHSTDSCTRSYPYDAVHSVESMDSVSVGSCDTVSSVDTQSLAMSEDSNAYSVEVKEDIVGILPMSVGHSPSHSGHFEQISQLGREAQTEVDLPNRTDCTTAPSSVASSATSASSANESGIVADSFPDYRNPSESGSQAHTPKDCSELGDSVEVIDLDQSLNRKRKLELLTGESDESKRGRSLDDREVTACSTSQYHSLSPSDRDQPSPADFPVSPQAPQYTPLPHSESGGGDERTFEGPGGPDPYPVSQAYTSYMNQSSAGEDITSRLPDDLGSDLPLNQIQPTIGNLMSDKAALNNNKGETGDEEYEFDLEELDPAEWEGKIAPKMALPDVLEISNSELRHLVEVNDYERLVRALRAKKVYDLEQPDQSGMTLAMIAAQHGYDDTLELLMLRGANINSEQKNGTSPLMLACEQGLRCTVSLLLEMGAHMNRHNHTGETALIKAVRCGHKHIVKILLDSGANFASPFNMDSPLKWARHQRDILDLLNAHISRLKAEFEHQVQITLNNTAHINCALFPMQCFALREAEKLRVIFKHELQPTKPGVGMLLFIAHACITPQEVRCRFYGPCAVSSATLNGGKLNPLTEEGNFVLSFCPLHNGRNELEILTAKAPTSKAKLVVCAYKAQLV